MSRYRGNGDTCPECGLTYKRCHTGLTWDDVFLGLRSPDPDPSTWRHVTRHTVLGKWHERKKELWRYHLDQCAEQARHDRAKRARKLAREETKRLSEVPF